MSEFVDKYLVCALVTFIFVLVSPPLTAQAEGYDNPLLQAFYEEYYQPVVTYDYIEGSGVRTWADLKQFHFDCTDITSTRMQLGGVAITADRLAAVALSIPDSPWEIKSILNYVSIGSNVHQLATDLGMADLPDTMDWLYKQFTYLGWINAARDTGMALGSLDHIWSFKGIKRIAESGLSPSELKNVLTIELFVLSVADQLMDDLLVGEIRQTYREDKLRVLLHSSCYVIASELEQLYAKAERRALTPIEATELMALERDYLVKNIDIYSLEMEYWKRQRDKWSPLDLFGFYGDKEHDEAMLEKNRQKYELAKDHYGRRDRRMREVFDRMEDLIEQTRIAEAQQDEAEREAERQRRLREVGAADAGARIRHDSPGSGGYFRMPRGLAVSRNGSVYVADTGNNRIQEFTVSGEFVRMWGINGSGAGQLSQPWDVAVAPDGTIYVVEAGNKRVQQFSAEGYYIRHWGSEGNAIGEFSSPRGIDIGRDGRVYVADTYNNRLQIFDAQGNYQTTLAERGNRDGQFLLMPDIAVAANGYIFALDFSSNRVQCLDGNGSYRWKLGAGRGNRMDQFIQPEGIAVAPDGSLYVADTWNHRIKHYDSSGNLLHFWGSSGMSEGQFNKPSGIAVSPDGFVYVADTFNHRIQYFTSDGRFIRAWGSEVR